VAKAAHTVAARLQAGDLVDEPARRTGAQIGVGDPGTVGLGRGDLGRVVGDRHDAEPQPRRYFDHTGRAGGVDALPSSHRGDAGVAQVPQGVGERLRAEVE
jgi:hypothetical protein